MAYEPNRLAWGLVREELRIPKKTMTGHMDVRRKLKEYGDHTLARGKRLQPREISSLSTITDHLVRKSFYTFGHREESIQIHNTTKRSSVNGYFYWWPCDKENFGPSSDVSVDPQYVESTLDLRYQRFSIDRRRMIYDSSFCSVTVGEHALYRLLDREYVGERPLAALSNSYMDLMSFTLVMHHGHMLTDGVNRTVLIPLGEGLLICRMVFLVDTDTYQHDKNHLRFLVDSVGSRNFTIPSPRSLKHVMDDQVGELGLQVQTYIDRSLMTSDQIWVWDRLREFIASNRSDLDWLALCMCTPESVEGVTSGRITLDNAQDICNRLREDMARLMMHQRWRSACNAPQVVR